MKTPRSLLPSTIAVGSGSYLVICQVEALLAQLREA